MPQNGGKERGHGNRLATWQVCNVVLTFKCAITSNLADYTKIWIKKANISIFIQIIWNFGLNPTFSLYRSQILMLSGQKSEIIICFIFAYNKAMHIFTVLLMNHIQYGKKRLDQKGKGSPKVGSCWKQAQVTCNTMQK